MQVRVCWLMELLNFKFNSILERRFAVEMVIEKLKRNKSPGAD